MQSEQRTPGDYIREALKAREWKQEDLARILGRPLPTVNEIIQGKKAIMPEMAIALADAIGDSAEVWMQREAAYRLSLVSGKDDAVKQRAKLFEIAPVKEMQKRGWIQEGDDPAVIESELKKFFRVENLDDEPQAGSMRKRDPNANMTPSQKAWVGRVRQLASANRTASYDEASIKACKRELRKLAAYSAEVRKVPQLLADHGIRFVVVEPLKDGKVDGVATWIDDRTPVIGMSLRFDRLDYFWFTLGHEVSHIDNRDEAPVDGDVSNSEELHTEAKSPVEQRADADAAAMFIDPDELKSFIMRVGPQYSKARINQFANRIKIHPAIVVGQLQHRGEIGYSANRDMLVKVRDTVASVALTDGWGNTIDRRVLE